MYIVEKLKEEYSGIKNNISLLEDTNIPMLKRIMQGYEENNELSEELKQKYINECKEEIEHFENHIKLWKENMIFIEKSFEANGVFIK